MKGSVAAGSLCVLISFASAMTLAGCGASAPQQHASSAKAAAHRGDQTVAVNLRGQPALDVPLSALTPAVEATLKDVRVGLSVRYEPPSDTSLSGINAWSETTLVPWAKSRTELAHEAVQSLAKADADGGMQRAIARWAVAWLMEDSVTLLLKVPIPDEVAEDAELKSIYQHARWSQMLSPWLNPAINDYADCAAAANAAAALLSNTAAKPAAIDSEPWSPSGRAS